MYDARLENCKGNGYIYHGLHGVMGVLSDLKAIDSCMAFFVKIHRNAVE